MASAAASRVASPHALRLAVAAPAAQAPLRVLALGPLRVSVGNREIPPAAWKSRKAELVLKYLLNRDPGRAVPKDALMEALWPGCDPALSGQSLRAAITALRRTLEPDLPSRGRSAYLFSNRGRCALTLGDGGFFDVAEFTRAAATERGRQGDDRGAAEAYRAAIALYRGDFLEDEPYADWAFSRRERLLQLYAVALVRLGTLELAQGDTSEPADLALRALEIDPASEPAYRLAITCYARGGLWGRARALHERYREAMQEHELPPPPSLKGVLEVIRP